MIVWIKLKNIGRHCQAGKRHHHGSDGHENRYQPIIGFGKKAFFGKEISIQQANGETEINNKRGNDALPPNVAHEVKIIVNRQWAIGNRQC